MTSARSKTHALARHLGTGCLEVIECLVEQELDSEFLENAQRRVMNGLEMVGGENLEWWIGIHETPPWRLRHEVSRRTSCPSLRIPPSHVTLPNRRATVSATRRRTR